MADEPKASDSPNEETSDDSIVDPDKIIARALEMACEATAAPAVGLILQSAIDGSEKPDAVVKKLEELFVGQEEDARDESDTEGT